MTGERIVFCVLAIIALCFPMRAKAQALPELPSATVTELHLVNQQAGDLAFNMNGVKLPSGASSILILNGIYKTMQAYNQWAGGDEYLVQQAYYMEKQNMPAWLAQYSGDYIFWEIQFFGDHINMITDSSGNLVLNPNGKKALNVMIDENMDSAVKIYKQQNNNSVQNLPVPNEEIDTNRFIQNTRKPFFVGKQLHFFVYIDGQEVEIMIPDASYTYFMAVSMESQNFLSFPAFIKGYPSSYTGERNYDINFVNVQTQQTLSKTQLLNVNIGGSGVTWGNGYTFNYFNASDSMRNIGVYLNEHSLRWFLPVSYWQGISGTITPRAYTVNSNNSVGAYGANNSFNFLKYTNNITGMFLSLQNGQEVNDSNNSLPVVGVPMSGDSIETITDAIAEIEPVVDPVTGIEIIEIPQNFPLPENIPLEEVPAPNPIPGGIEDFPQSDPEIAPPYDPSIEPGTTPTEDTLPDSAEQIQPMEELQLVTGLQNRFPFSIPWDIYNAYKMLQAEREIPHWEWEMSVNLPGGEVFTHIFVLDLEFIDPVVGLFRDLFLLAFILGLAIYSYNKFFGGGA